MERKGFSSGGSWADRRKQVQPVSISQTQLVKTGFLPGQEDGLPLVVEPEAEFAGTLKLHEWAKDNVEMIEKSVLKYGGVLFRNFDTKTHDDFNRFLETLGVNLVTYNESSTPAPSSRAASTRRRSSPTTRRSRSTTSCPRRPPSP